MRRRKGGCFSMARTTAHAIITEGEGACFPFFLLAASRAVRTASHRVSICKLAGITRQSLRVIVGESAGSIAVAGVVDPTWVISRLDIGWPRSAHAAIASPADSFAVT